MILCKNDCTPCCDFCIYVIHDSAEINGELVKFGPIGCKLHTDKKHQDIAEACGCCKDFHCFLASDDHNKKA